MAERTNSRSVKWTKTVELSRRGVQGKISAAFILVLDALFQYVYQYLWRLPIITISAMSLRRNGRIDR